MPSKFTSLVSTLTAIAGLSNIVAADYPIKVQNNCPYTIWPGVAEHNFAGISPFVTASKPNRGAMLKPGETWTATAPDRWIGGRMWARTGCDETCMTCKVGQCPGGVQCEDYNWTDKLTVAEWGWGQPMRNSPPRLWWNLSVMQGYNIPMCLHEASTDTQKICNSPTPPKGQAWIPSDGVSSDSVGNSDPTQSSFTITFCCDASNPNGITVGGGDNSGNDGGDSDNQGGNNGNGGYGNHGGQSGNSGNGGYGRYGNNNGNNNNNSYGNH